MRDPRYEVAAQNPTRVLVVTDRTAATPALLDTIRGRAARSRADFRVLVPNPAPAEWNPLHPERHKKVDEAERELASSIPRIAEAAGHPVEGVVSIRHDPMDAIEETLLDEPFDEIILATTPHTVAGWLHVDLPRRVAHLGLPVTTVTGEHHAGAND
jgi:hypothetical protein